MRHLWPISLPESLSYDLEHFTAREQVVGDLPTRTIHPLADEAGPLQGLKQLLHLYLLGCCKVLLDWEYYRVFCQVRHEFIQNVY